MKLLDSFKPSNAQEEAAMELSKQLCFEGDEFFRQDRFQDALDTYREDLQVCGDFCGRDHSYFANSLWDMAACYYRLGNSDFALTLFRRALDIHQNACGSNHHLTARDIGGIAHCLVRAGQYDQALSLHYRQLYILEKNWGVRDERVARVCGYIAELEQLLGQHEQAVLFLRHKLVSEEKLCGVDSAQAIATVMDIANVHEELQQYELSLPFRMRALAYYEGKDDSTGCREIVATLGKAANCLGKLGRRDLALTMLQRAMEMNRELHASESRQTAILFRRLSERYLDLGESDVSTRVRSWARRIEDAITGSPQEELCKGALEGEIERVREALGRGAIVDVTDRYGRTALIEAATHGHLDIAEMLIGLGADVNHADKCERTPLSSSVAHCHAELFELLIRNGADIDASCEEGRSLLMECCINNPEMFERLVELCPDLERRDRQVKTALIHAAEWGRLALVEALIKRGANVEVADGAGRTALMYAARGKATQFDADYLAVVRLLLCAGAQTTRSDWNDKTALDYAREGDELMGVRHVQDGVVELLESFMHQCTDRLHGMQSDGGLLGN